MNATRRERRIALLDADADDRSAASSTNAAASLRAFGAGGPLLPPPLSLYGARQAEASLAAGFLAPLSLELLAAADDERGGRGGRGGRTVVPPGTVVVPAAARRSCDDGPAIGVGLGSSGRGGSTDFAADASDDATSWCAKLPENFAPGPWTVIVGRDKAALDCPGNKKLHMIISWYLDRYASLGAAEKEAKGSIISEIEDTVRRACGGGRGAFVRKHDEGGWVEIPVMQARGKIGRLIREALHEKYSSSSKQKRARRRARALAVALAGVDKD